MSVLMLCFKLCKKQTGVHLLEGVYENIYKDIKVIHLLWKNCVSRAVHLNIDLTNDDADPEVEAADL